MNRSGHGMFSHIAVMCSPTHASSNPKRSSVTSCSRSSSSVRAGSAPGGCNGIAKYPRCSTAMARILLLRYSFRRREMRFGTYYFLQAPPALTHADVFRREIEQMAWTEELGFDSLWLTEHHFIEYGLSVSPTVLAAAAAMRTRRVRIGLAAAILPFHDPIRVAEELAMVDILSGGR